MSKIIYVKPYAIVLLKSITKNNICLLYDPMQGRNEKTLDEAIINDACARNVLEGYQTKGIEVCKKLAL